VKATFPNLFIIGAMKAGTSSLHEYLHQHPQIFMCRFKEPQYFAPHATRWGQMWGIGHPWPEPGIDWYLRLFQDAGDVKYAGESSASYTARPWVVECERRIHQFNSQARIIYLLRDPVERAISHYWHFVGDGREDLDMLTALQRKEEYVARSNYWMQLEPYLDLFGRDQVHVLTIEQLMAAPAETFRRLFAWLEVDPDVAIRTDERHNVGREQLRQTRRHLVRLDTMRKHWRWRQAEPYIPRTVLRGLDQLTYKRVDRGAVDTTTSVAYLRHVLRRLTRPLCAALGRDFPEWTTLALAPMATAEMATKSREKTQEAR
jgi:hypothetical protein